MNARTDVSRRRRVRTSLKESRNIDTPLDRVWQIVSNVDKDPAYWSGLVSIRNIRKEENYVEREVVLGFMGRRGTQRIVLNPKKSVQLTLMTGPLRGSRITRLTSLEPKKTKVKILWDIEFSEVPEFAQGFVLSRLEASTHDALERIAKAAEGSK